MENLISKHQDLFKSNNKDDLQEKRRQLLLNEHKIKRSLIQDEFRNIHKAFTDVAVSKHKTKSRTFKAKYGIDYKLQLSEWMKEKLVEPSEWILVPCPKGFRCMVIACSGRTEVYTKNGKLFDTFRSLLPGDGGCRSDVTILDCIYVENQSTFYVLDAISYGNQDLHYCEAQFRFFWIASKLVESSLDEISRRNEYKFACIEYCDFLNSDRIRETFQKFPMWPDDCPALDGYLFYHKEASYTFGTTPLVVWLFPFMVPELFGYSVHSAYTAQRPDNYVDYLHYIVEFDEMMAKKRVQQKGSKNRMTKMDEDVCKPQSDGREMDDDDNYLKLVLKSQRDLELEGSEDFDAT